MKVLLDTNIIIHRETKDPINKDIGTLFWWLDRLGYQKCIHQVILNEISRNQDAKAREAFQIKLKSYYCLPTVAPLRAEAISISEKYDKTENDRNDTSLINEVLCNRVDLILSEDRGLHDKARMLGVDSVVFTIEKFLERVREENPSLLDYKVLSVRQDYFGNIDLNDPFFSSFKEDYLDFVEWFNKKHDQIAYVCKSDGNIDAFLYVKKEGPAEPSTDITPPLMERNHLKIGTLKARSNGLKLGERLLKIVFDNGLRFSVDDIYVTIFPKRDDQLRLIELLKDFGFAYHGIKQSVSGREDVYVRDFPPTASLTNPKTTFPFLSRRARKFIVPIYPEYHTNLFPDSILRTESPLQYVENEPFRNAISKVYISRSLNRDLKSGDVIIFYRTGGTPGGRYKGVVTTLGVVEHVITEIPDFSTFAELCRGRSVFTVDQLKQQWDRYPNKPFIVKFLYAYSFQRRINLDRLIKLGIIKDTSSVPRGFEEIDDASFGKIVQESQTDGHLIVD